MNLIYRLFAVCLLTVCAFTAAVRAADNTLYGIELSTGATQRFFSIDQTSGAATVTGVAPTFTSAAMARRASDGVIFYTEYTDGGSTTSGRVATWNPATNAKTTLGTTPGTQFIRLTFNSSGALYAMNQNNQLYTINTTSGAATLLGTVTGSGLAVNGGGDIAFSPNETLYMTVGSNLYTISGLTASLVGSTGIATPPTGLAFGIDGNLYSTVLSSSNSPIYKINPATAASTLMPAATGAPIGDLASMPKYADLQITKTAGGNLPVGQNATYTLTVRNNGPQTPSAPITVTDVLPAGLTYVSAAGAGWTCGNAGGTVTCTSSTLPAPNTNMTPITLVVAVSPTAPASITNTATVSSQTFDQTAANNSSTVTTSTVVISISGTVYEDLNYAGGSGRSLSSSGGVGRSGARVELYSSSDAFLAFAATGVGGAYTFPNLAPATDYKVRVVNSTVSSSRVGAVSTLIGVQTYRTTNGAGDANRVGGEDPTKIDAAANTAGATLASLTTATTAAQSISTVTISTASVVGVDFGFNFDTIVNVNDSAQGSLRQFITNANALSGADTTVFMISDGVAHSGLRSGLINQLTGGVAVITLQSLLPAVSDSNTTIDGTTQTTNVGNTNSGTLGAGGIVGVDRLTLSTVQRPEVQITDGAANLAIGLDLQGASETVRGVSIYGFGAAANSDTSANIRLGVSAANALIEQNIIGATATSFADPGSGARSGGDNVRSVGADNGILRNNLIGFSAGKGFGVEGGSTGWTIETNEIRGNGIGNPNLDGIDFETAGTTNNTARGNLIADNEGVGVDSYLSNGSNTIVNNTITNNGIGAGANVETAGVRLFGANNTIDRNIINANFGAGVMATSGASANTITRNSIFANGTILNKSGAAASNQIGIDLQSSADNISTGTAPFVTVNDSGDADAGANGLLNFPVLENARILSGNLVLTGFARPGATIEFFVAAPDASGFGEGQTYLFTFNEGAPEDTDATTGTYTSPFNGKTVGADTTNRFQFSLALPANISVGTPLTATATASAATSEFSNTITVGNAPPAVGLVKSVSPTGTQMPGAELTYTIAFTNTGGQAAANFSLIDPNPANTTLRLNTNTDFKIGSIVNSLGTTGLTATISYSNDGGASYTYTPVSQGGGAPAGFDRNVTHVRWTFAGSLSPTAPNNAGSISFVVRIR